MRVKLVLPALTEAASPFFRPIKYSLFPPLGLATLAAYLDDGDDVEICDEHVAEVPTCDAPDLVGIEVCVTNARRAYELAALYRSRGAHVCLGGLHVTACPEEAALHADTVFLGPGDDTWPQFLRDFRAGHPRAVYRSTHRCLHGTPRPRRDLIDRVRYLVPNSIVVSRGCPHACHFCYKESSFTGGRSFYTRRVDEPRGMSAAELERGYWRAYRDFYSWGSIARGTLARGTAGERVRHLAYQVGWKKAEPVWDALIRARRLGMALPLLERVLGGGRGGRGRCLQRQRPEVSIPLAIDSN